jgi:hypothetical protein
MEVFLLWHVHEFPQGEEDVKLLGVYSTRELAQEAHLRLASQPGFQEHPQGFQVSAYQVDKDHWTKGYVTEMRQDLVQKVWKDRVT